MSGPSGRLLTLLSLLQARRDWPGDELAQRLEVSARTVRRDVDRLRELGYPVQAVKGPDGGYRLAPGTALPPLLFDDEQAVAIAVALQTATASIDGVQEAAVRALATIRQVLPARLRHRVDALQVTAVPRVSSATDGPLISVDTLVRLGRSCRDAEVLRFGYVDGRGAASVRVVEPHRLVSRGQRWYVVSWDRDRQDWRCFRADRMILQAPTGRNFTARALTDQEVQHLLEPEARMPTWEAHGTVVMHSPAHEVARWVAAHQGRVTALDEHTCRVEVGSWSFGSLAAWLLLFETDFEVIEPAELGEALAAVAERAWRASAAGAAPHTRGRGVGGNLQPREGNEASRS